MLLLIAFGLLVGWMLYFGITFPIKQIRLLTGVREKIWIKYLKPDDDDD